MTTHTPDLSVEQAVQPSVVPSRKRRVPSSLLVFVALLLVAIGLQIASGAYHSEFGSYPDESAHYVTSLMVREYIVHPVPFWPMQFAQNYYAHYPKVAFGHWPPLFYVVQAFWMMLFTASRTSIRLELAVTTALWSWFIYKEARRWFGFSAGVFAALLTVCLPLVQASTDEEMAETLLALTCFLSTVYFARFIESERRSDALWFAVFFSLAVLTKGSAWFLVFIPPIALVLTNKIRLPFSSSFWLAVGVIAVCCLPWQLMTLKVAERGWAGGTAPNVHYTKLALIEFASLLPVILGPVLAIIFAIGVGVTIVMPIIRRRRCSAAPAVMLALILGDWVFHSVVPAGVEDRKMIMAVPGLILFLVAGIRWIADWFPTRNALGRYRFEALLATLFIVFAFTTFFVPRQKHYGYSDAAKFIASDQALRGSIILVSSGGLGEGLLISELAMHEPRPQDTVIRGTKAFAHVDWTGLHYSPLLTNEQQLVNYIERSRIRVVVTDDLTPITNFQHNHLLRQAIESNPSKFRLLRSFASASLPGSVQVFETR